MSANRYQVAHDKLDAIVGGALQARAVELIRCYFSEPEPASGRQGYTGRRFERLGGGGDAPDTCNLITATDLLAVTLLGVEHGIGRVAIAVLEHQRCEIARLLDQIPRGPIHAVPYATVAPGSAAWRLWNLLRRAGGIDRSVTASKLLARKRPALLPVDDPVVQAELGKPGDIWECYWTWFDADPSRVARTGELRAAAGAIDDVSLLRCLDVALWMLGSG